MSKRGKILKAMKESFEVIGKSQKVFLQESKKLSKLSKEDITWVLAKLIVYSNKLGIEITKLDTAIRQELSNFGKKPINNSDDDDLPF